MRVLHVIPAIAACYGGPSKVVFDTCKALRDAGIDAEIATTNADENGDLALPAKLPTTIDSVPVYVFRRHGQWRYKISWDLWRWLDRNVRHYDLLHIHAAFSFSTAAAAYYARRYRVPYIMLPHGMLGPWPMQQKRLLKRIYLAAIEKRNLSHAAGVQFTANDELRTSILNGSASFVLPYVLDLTIPSNGRSPACSAIRILYLGRLDPKKGIELLIQALADLVEAGHAFQFVVAGSGAPQYEERVKAMIGRSSQLAAATSFVGFVEGSEKAKLLRESDIFVLPSYDENFGIAVTEAMAAGLATIVSDRVNIHDEIAKQEAGLVVAPTAVSVREAILKLINNPELRARIARKGRELVKSKFASPVTTRETIRVYYDVINKSRESACWRHSATL